MYFTYVSHKIMAYDYALAVVPITSNFDLTSQALDSVHRFKMVRHVVIVDGLAALQSIRTVPITKYRDETGDRQWIIRALPQTTL